MKKQSRYLVMAIFSLVIAASLLPFVGVQLPVLANTGDTFGIAVAGDFAGTLPLSEVTSPQLTEQSSTWSWIETEDYIFFRDSTSTAGFKINFYMSSVDTGNFVYSGSSAAQGNVDVANFKVWGGYEAVSGTYFAATKGVDSATTTLNIDSSISCVGAQTLSNYTFHDDLLSATKEYGLTMSSGAQTYLSSTLDCEVEGTLDIRRMRLTYPEASNGGTYESTLIIIMVDGT